MRGACSRFRPPLLYDSASKTVTFTPGSAYAAATYTATLSNITDIAGNALDTSNGRNTFEFTRVTDTQTVTVTAGANGTITPGGTVTVPQDITQPFTITPAVGYKLYSITTNAGALLLTDPSVTLNGDGTTTLNLAVAKIDRTVAVTFAPSTVTLSVTTGASGSLTIYDKGGDATSALTRIELAGVSAANSTSGRLYWGITKVAPNVTVNLYRDSTGTLLVGSGTIGVDAGIVTISPQNNSGISGRITVSYTLPDAVSK